MRARGSAGRTASLAVILRCRTDAAVAAAQVAVLAAVADDLLVAVAAGVADAARLAAAGAPRVVRLPELDPPERMDGYLLAQAHGDWVLWLDEGELPSPELTAALPRLVGDPRHSHYLVPVRAGGGPPSPFADDHELRLHRRDPALVRVPGVAGAPPEVAGAGRWIDEPIHATARAASDSPAPDPAPAREPAAATIAEVDASWASHPLEAEAYSADLEIVDPDLGFRAGGGRVVLVSVANRGPRTWPWLTAGRRICLSYRWLDRDGAVVVAEGLRSRLPGPVPAGEATLALVSVAAPPAGRYLLEVDLVDEGVAWFGRGCRAEIEVIP